MHEKITMNTKSVFVGDISYIIQRPLLTEVWGAMDYADGILAKDGNVIAVVGGTASGDGVYFDNQDHMFDVDAGVIGVSNMNYAREDAYRSGVLVSTPSGTAIVDFYDNEGSFNITIYDGRETEKHIVYKGTILTY